jgi:hypothetical protein
MDAISQSIHTLSIIKYLIEILKSVTIAYCCACGVPRNVEVNTGVPREYFIKILKYYIIKHRYLGPRVTGD